MTVNKVKQKNKADSLFPVVSLFVIPAGFKPTTF